ncbi:hypothetical protein Cgig2_004205 [Carnegiea gigantea]|uniref:General transcription factor 3C polypeptide 3 n=1 Tax=Carnegiea gigantea TaxID=171969 RepID=A0A9Q1KSQ0_9CARY|nr:hypothetical protein Cgig2_004205 [Carnegiea gigantea]
MESEDGTSHNPIEEREGYAEEAEEEVREDGDGREEEEAEEGEDELDCDVRFEGEMNPLDLIKDDNCGVQLYQQFEQYEALAESRRKALAAGNAGEGSAKKRMREETDVVTIEEMMEAMGMHKRSRKAKKRGRRKGSKKKLSPEITRKLGDATLHYAHGRYEEAIGVLTEVVQLAPNLPDPYHTLGLVYNSMGEKKKATDCCMIAAFLGPKESSLWKLLVTWSIEQGNTEQAWFCLNKAITADPGDITLRYDHASLYMEIGEYQKAADSYYQIVQVCPDNVEALQTATMLYKKCGQFERAIGILEDYLKDHPPKDDPSVVEMLVSIYMERNEHSKALEHIEYAKRVCSCGEEFPLNLTIREGICHAHLGDLDKAEFHFSALQKDNAKLRMGLVMAVANSFMSLQHYESALKYYLMLEGCASNNDLISVKIARCYSALKKSASAIQFYYKALQAHENDVDTRLTLTSLLMEENRDDEALALLSPPPNSALSNEIDVDKSQPWWLNVKVKLKLSHIYKTKGMLEAYVEVMYPIIHESLTIDSMHQKVKQRKKLSESELLERVKVLGDQQTDSVFGNFRRPASKNALYIEFLSSNCRSALSIAFLQRSLTVHYGVRFPPLARTRLKANRAKKSLQKIATSKEEMKSAALAAGLDWESDDSNDEVPQQPLKEPPLPDLFKDEEHCNLISDIDLEDLARQLEPDGSNFCGVEEGVSAEEEHQRERHRRPQEPPEERDERDEDQEVGLRGTKRVVEFLLYCQACLISIVEVLKKAFAIDPKWKLCTALTSLRRNSEALSIIKLTLKITCKTLPAEKKEKFRSLGAQIALNMTDPSDGFDFVRYMVKQRPQSITAWNCYYRLVSRLDNRLSKHYKFWMRLGRKDLVPPMIIYANQFTMISQHQVAAREYLKAYKRMPENPLVNLCVGTALVNLALGFRLQNKHQCVAQGLAFLYNNLSQCENSQEALYNVARACHHVGLVSLAAFYYEKVLAIRQEDCPLPKLVKLDADPTKQPEPGYCDLRREAAYNLHLIYKKSGAVDLARQVLKDYCTL